VVADWGLTVMLVRLGMTCAAANEQECGDKKGNKLNLS
jgi:hypothetical protein